MDIPVQLGFKLALGWRAYVESGHLPGPARDLYSALSDADFAFFEFGTGTCREESERDLLRGEATACAQRGLCTSLHPYTKGAENPAVFGVSGEAHAAMLAMLRAATDVAGIAPARPRMVLHSAEAAHQPTFGTYADYRRKLLGRSRAYFAVLAELCAADFPAVRPAVEFQMPTDEGSPVVRIGDAPDELLEASAGLPLCLDVGHYLLSVDRYGLEPVPPDGLLRRVSTCTTWWTDATTRSSPPARTGRVRASRPCWVSASGAT